MGDQVQILNGCTLEAMLIQQLADGLQRISVAWDRLGWDPGRSKPMLQIGGVPIHQQQSGVAAGAVA